ncbi:TonB-dependent receptor [Mucilaginibacter achroorhodeus]|uniref:TonB-dependent receptor n=1 Tax=Mucilaginibacter achroorhodeus TaxID=2599294 RepID=A0A563U9U4_9SPHI|nr:TonB-dependent receptor [Mucilaginibacter achroorhodeus]TWR28053.1 TonB-dependent receptor [Mucilaginibacter achroorhodeus]
MKKSLALLVALLCHYAAFSQNTYTVFIKDAETKKPLPGAAVAIVGTTIGAMADTSGKAYLSNISSGLQIVQYSYVGYITRRDTLTFPLDISKTFTVLLKQNDEGNELEEVTVAATRSSRTIANIPTRVEVISGEELDEKGNMKPGDIRMLLAESTGIQTQQTSATSGNSSIRIQGLDGKYTQIIRDGFPLYSGFAGGLGLLQIAPLDLKQVEVIKGSASTLYGGGAIAGLVNLVSKTPTDKRQLNFLLNGTSAGGLDLSGFYGQKFLKTGVTVYAAYNHGSPYDPAGIDLSAIPKFNRYTLNPKIYFYLTPKATLDFGVNATVEKRIGGDMHYIEGNGSTQHSYFEANNTERYATTAKYALQIDSTHKFTVKNSVGLFNRKIQLPDYIFSGKQLSTYSEANYLINHSKTEWIFGLNYITDKFEENRETSFPLRNYDHQIIGGFVQNTWDISPRVILETGLRGDHHNQYGFMFLPRISALWKISDKISTRLGGGLGYKAPNVFTEDAERIQFRNVLPMDASLAKAERSLGVNLDANYRTGIFDEQVSFSINQLFFYTRINNPILLASLPNGNLQYQQPRGDLNTKGTETNLKFGYRNFKLYIGYTYADVTQHTLNTVSVYPLVSKHRLNNVLFYEIEDSWKIGAEAYYFSPQRLNDGTTGRAYWTTGLMVEKIWKRLSVFVNFENLTDTRQTKFGPIYTGSITNPVFKDIYAPLDGFVANGGIKLKL